ncbi:MAG: glucose-6-phosphate isomerase [Gammaproteobacteria bacterium]|nr:glucose-6-phosphate isomerase [Gammaproteobacteria bacterium]
MATDLLQAPAWKALQRHASSVWLAPGATSHLRDQLNEAGRFDAFSRLHGDCLLDFSRNRISAHTLKLLIALASERGVPASIQALFAGETVNPTENRPAQHMALRGPDSPPLVVGGTDIRVEIAAERERMLALADSIRSGEFRGATGGRIRHVVNIGIGGSDLGLVMAIEALHEFSTSDVKIHYASNVDGTQLADILAEAPAAETLFIVCSKSFATWETALNAAAARAWLTGQLGEAAVARHFVAVSVNAAAMDEFGIGHKHRFRIWDWVGGRYSLWSSIGLAIAIAVGSDHFRDLLAGGRELDEHFRTAPLADNLPVLLALIAVWNQNLLGTTSQAILPYDGRLHRFAAYLQQLEMESNGKGVTQEGQPVQWSTGTVIWGEPGNNAQHSFFQLLHQGTANFAADFIAPVEGSSPYADQHLVGLANLLAQAEAFARGYTLEAAKAELAAKGKSPADVERLAPHKVHPGNHPSNILLLRRLDPRSLGFLIALYEQKVFVQACIWGINPFDQWGVELGKLMATGMHEELQSTTPTALLPGIGHVIRRWTSDG